MEKNLTIINRTIIITRALGQQGESRRRFEEIGASVLDLPALEIGPPDKLGPLDDALEELKDFHWIIFSSSNGVDAVEKQLRAKNLTLNYYKNSFKIAAIGRKTADHLKKIGVKVDFIPPNFVADSLIDNFPISGAGLRVFIPRVQTGGRTILAESFRESGADVVEVAAYQSRCPKNIPEYTLEALDNLKVDAITFTSSKIVANTFSLLKAYFGRNFIGKLNDVKLISIGPQTSLSCIKYFSRVDEEAKPHDIDGLVTATLNALS